MPSSTLGAQIMEALSSSSLLSTRLPQQGDSLRRHAGFTAACADGRQVHILAAAQIDSCVRLRDYLIY